MGGHEHDSGFPGANQQAVPVGTSSGLLVPASPTRMGLVIAAPVANFLVLSFGKPVSDGAGIKLYAADAPLVLQGRGMLGLIRSQVYAQMDTSGETIAYVEGN